MLNSNANKPDLDWSQVRETSRLLILSAVQVEDMMSEADVSVNTLTDSFTDLVEHMKSIDNFLHALAPTESRDQAIAYCEETAGKINESIIAFQFYDRMVQCLQHVTINLKGLSELVADQNRLYNPRAWSEFQQQIRSRYTMESEKVMFDAILQGKSVAEALALKSAHQREQSDDDVELF
ncbi:MAG: hypothetical protein ABL919_10815 [Methylococcales bacterium]|nr:hypothetical protein [Methylococcaceae bacterium]